MGSDRGDRRRANEIIDDLDITLVELEQLTEILQSTYAAFGSDCFLDKYQSYTVNAERPKMNLRESNKEISSNK